MYYYIMNFVHDRHSPLPMNKLRLFPLANAHYIMIRTFRVFCFHFPNEKHLWGEYFSVLTGDVFLYVCYLLILYTNSRLFCFIHRLTLTLPDFPWFIRLF